VKAWIAAAAGAPKMIRKRRIIQASARVDTRYLSRVVAPQNLGSPTLARLARRLSLLVGQ
jgi:hypothetical protein